MPTSDDETTTMTGMSRGLVRSIVRSVSEEGAPVTLTAYNEQRIEETGASLPHK